MGGGASGVLGVSGWRKKGKGLMEVDNSVAIVGAGGGKGDKW